jgi:long-chain acyl-CoA synthetase
MFRSAVERAPSRDAVRYFDQSLSYRRLDRLSDSFAVWLLRKGIEKGDRVAIVLQNVPQFLIVAIAAWKMGAVATPINPMNRQRELALLFSDCKPKVIVCHASSGAKLVAEVLNAGSDFSDVTLLTTSALSFQSRNDERVLATENSAPPSGAGDLLVAIKVIGNQSPPPVEISPDDPAMIVYTSGTSGVPKGAILTHGNIAFNAQVYRDWLGLREGGAILGLAPLFHITGLIGQIAAAFLVAAPLILTFRFRADVMIDSIVEHQPEFAIGAITAFIALANASGARREDFASLRAVYSGGAAIPPAFVEEFQTKFGHYIHAAYGLTETTSPSHFVPLGCPAPIDPQSGCLSIGVPVFNSEAKIVDNDGRELAVRGLGEILIRGPMVIPGYWNKPKETVEVIADGWLRTGDIGFMDEKGWFYLVDRKKDMINAAGFKVWPREIEDVLYTHPAVREAAVVGVPDSYRGETVKAVVSLRLGESATVEELAAFCKERMAAYKYPRIIEIVEELPKTVTGKILRRALR